MDIFLCSSMSPKTTSLLDHYPDKFILLIFSTYPLYIHILFYLCGKNIILFILFFAPILSVLGFENHLLFLSLFRCCSFRNRNHKLFGIVYNFTHTWYRKVLFFIWTLCKMKGKLMGSLNHLHLLLIGILAYFYIILSNI